MGWLFGFSTRKALAEHLVSGNGVHTVRHCFKGNNLWAIQTYEKDGQQIPFVALYMLRGCDQIDKRTGRYDANAWGYKALDETACPTYSNCPLSYIEYVEAWEKKHGVEPVGYAGEWRQRVRAYHARAKLKLEVGQKFKLYGTEYCVVEKLPRGCYRIDNGSQYYKLPRRMLNAVEVM